LRDTGSDIAEVEDARNAKKRLVDFYIIMILLRTFNMIPKGNLRLVI